MDVIFGTNVDLITPFPQAEIPRIWDWMQCFESVVFHDHSAQREEYEKYFEYFNQQGLTFGIIDKHNLTGSTKIEAPIVGMLMLEPASPTNFYGHVACSRKAGKSWKLYKVSMVDEAVKLMTDYAFENTPSLMRISAIILESNSPVKSLLRRTGFVQDGNLESWFTQNGEPKTCLHYGKLRGR